MPIPFLFSPMTTSVQGGAIQPVKIVTSADLEQNGGVYTIAGRVARRVHGFSAASRSVEQGDVQPVYVVSAAQVAAGQFAVEGGAALPIIDIADIGATNLPVTGRVAIPVYPVNSWP